MILCATCAGDGAHSRDVLLWTLDSSAPPAESGLGAAAFARAGDGVWIAYTTRTNDRDRIHLAYARGARDGHELAPVASFDGRAPSLGIDADGRPFVVARAARRDGGAVLLLHRAESGAGDTWSEPDTILRGHDVRIGPGRLARTRDGVWLLPLYADGAHTVLRSSDTRTWTRAPLHAWLPDALEPALAEAPDGTWIGIARCRTSLVCTLSRDAGTSWTAFDTLAALPRLDVETAFAVTTSAAGVLLAWTETPPDLVLVEPGVWSLRLAHIAWDAATFTQQPPLAWRAGAAPAGPALLALDGAGLVAWFTVAGTHNRDQGRTAAIVLRTHAATPEATPAGATSLGDLCAPAAVATDLWAQHTLARPKPSRRLFVECYAMRGIVAAHAVLAPLRAGGRTLLGADTERGIADARAYAESLLARQDARGYWPLGYDAKFVADMAVTTGLYAALDPYVDAVTRRRYVESARRFLAALAADGLVHAAGEIGVGWSKAQAGHDSLALRQPYVVSTALAGVATRAWLFACTGEADFARDARTALERTLDAIAPDGSIPAFTAGALTEGRHWSATYVHEGWMFADRYLDDARIRARLRRALPPHIDWLLRTQNPDGTWGDRAAGESTRTVAISNFLVWYDQRCDSRDDVRQAIRRASAALVDPDRWLEAGLLYQGNQEDAQRALAARSLVSLAASEPVY